MSSDEKLKVALYAACLRSANAMGEKLKTISWFGRNLKDEKSQNKKAA